VSDPGLLWLQADPTGGLIGFMPVVLIIFIFYVLLIRPQSKRQKEHQAMLASIEKGDNVVTAGGIHGKVTGVTDDVLTLEIAALKGERVRVKVARERIDSVQKPKKGEEE
jgi:preprotein translocase subunit YajC